MFAASPKPRVFGLAPGIEFPRAFVAGLLERLGPAAPPEALARAEIWVNSGRMAASIEEAFSRQGARLLPRIAVVAELAQLPVLPPLPPPVPPLRRRLELAHDIRLLIDRQPDLAPRSALFGLADSLAALLAEMQDEAVPAEAVLGLDTGAHSAHWARSLAFLRIVETFAAQRDSRPDAEARRRVVVERLVAKWQAKPPEHPVIVAGSTGSRGTTAAFMAAVASLPQGAVVLPGFDFDMPQAVWDTLDDALTGEDHPQFRFRRLMQTLDLTKADIRHWTDAPPPDPLRNRLISLSLRPAPVTDQWLTEGPQLGDLSAATARMTLVEAPSPRIEAETIALRLRAAAALGQSAALISPDRMLTRMVTAALDRWDILPDDSAGMPFLQSPPGRLLRQTAEALGRPIGAADLLALIKHPLVHSGAARGPHLLHSREFELALRRHGAPHPDRAFLMRWAAGDESRVLWAAWLADAIEGLAQNTGENPFAETLSNHIAMTEQLAAGPQASGAGALWDEAAGRVAVDLIDALRTEADAGSDMTAREYADFVTGILGSKEVRAIDAPHPLIRIWGTLESRVQGSDLVILGGLNEGKWPESPPPDPWLNRAMRKEAGLLMPERKIGLAAHDYQQAVAAPEVWLTRAIRGDEAETVAARWIGRLTNLVGGLGPAGEGALNAMRDRGAGWIAEAQHRLRPDHAVDRARRPSPRPPIAARPRRLSVTAIERLIRDPYAIYARHVLRLEKLEPLTPDADARLRGNILHRVLELFIQGGTDPAAPDAAEQLLQIAADQLAIDCPWPVQRMIWQARFAANVPAFLAAEVGRRASANPAGLELKGQMAFLEPDFLLTCKADRIDRLADGQLALYDYKTGAPPTPTQQMRFNKQLLLEAMMVEAGAFAGIQGQAALAAFLGVGKAYDEVIAPLADTPAPQIRQEFLALLAAWSEPARGYTARMAHFKEDDRSDYDHLSRFGEWSPSDDPMPEDLT